MCHPSSTSSSLKVRNGFFFLFKVLKINGKWEIKKTKQRWSKFTKKSFIHQSFIFFVFIFFFIFIIIFWLLLLLFFFSSSRLASSRLSSPHSFSYYTLECTHLQLCLVLLNEWGLFFFYIYISDISVYFCDLFLSRFLLASICAMGKHKQQKLGISHSLFILSSPHLPTPLTHSLTLFSKLLQTDIATYIHTK